MPAPADIKARLPARTLEVLWSDAHAAVFPFKYLRCHCGCAECVDERSGVRILDPTAVPDDVHIEDMSLVGHYAIQFQWSDGHGTGIYSWDLLQQICPCPRCGGPKPFDRRPSPLGTNPHG